MIDKLVLCFVRNMLDGRGCITGTQACYRCPLKISHTLTYQGSMKLSTGYQTKSNSNVIDLKLTAAGHLVHNEEIKMTLQLVLMPSAKVYMSYANGGPRNFVEPGQHILNLIIKFTDKYQFSNISIDQTKTKPMLMHVNTKRPIYFEQFSPSHVITIN